MGIEWKQWQILLSWAPKSLRMVIAAMKLRHLLHGRKAMTKLNSILESRHYFANKDPSHQGYGFSSSHVWMWELDYNESLAPKNWCFWTVVLEKTLENPLDCKEIQPVHSKGDQSWMFIRDWCWSWNCNTLAMWCKELTHLKRLWCWERWRAGEKGTTEDEMVGSHHWLNGDEFE